MKSLKSKSGIKKIKFIFSLILIIFTIQLVGQTLAFPEAEGFGKYTTGGRGGDVIEVTNLDDNGPGSLRAAIEESGVRTIVFKVSGTIFLQSDLVIDNDNITIAGQTAPGDGITIANYSLIIDADNVIVRYIRSRLGDDENQEADAFTCIGKRNVIIDHCSFSWGIDEVATSYSNTNYTMQWCIISESLYHSIHSKGNHGYGGIWGGDSATFHHNLIAHHTSRMPRFNGGRYNSEWYELADYRNNIIYNWGFNNCYGGEPSEIDGSIARINMVKNYYKAGPGTDSGEKQYRIVEPDQDPSYGFSNWHIDSNYIFGYPDATNDNWTYGVQGITPATKDAIKSIVPFDYDITTVHTAQQAFNDILLYAGANIPKRDTIDKRIVYETLTGTATYGGIWGAASGIIDSQTDVGGWPVLFSAPALTDTDHDGMPDEWELLRGLNPDNENDRNGDDDTDGYTNLEEYLNSIIAFPEFILPPSDLNIELAGINNISLSWQKNGEGYDGFIIERKSAGQFTQIDTVDFFTTGYADTALMYETMYYYRVRSFLGTDTSVASNLAGITTLPENGLPYPSSNPVPNDHSKIYSESVILQWDAGLGASSHNVYLGLSDPPDFVQNQSGTTYNVAGLIPGETYYWRIDEMNVNGTTQGEVWTFTVGTMFPESLVGYWQFEEGTVVYDSSDYNNHGNYYNFEENSFIDRSNNSRALQFNGENQYVYIPDHLSLDFHVNSFTISFWLKQSRQEIDTTKEYRYIVKGSNIENPLLERSGKRYEVYYKANNDEFCFAIDDNDTRSQIVADGEKFVNGKWIHIAAIRDTSVNRLYLYANGSLVKLTSDGTGDISQGEDMYFGTNPDYPEFLIGMLDDIRIYNYALTGTEIDDLYFSGLITKTNISEFLPEIRIFPNPGVDLMYCIIPDVFSGNISAQIINTYGQIVLNKNFKSSGEEIISFDIKSLNPGIYIIKISGNDKILVGRFIKE